MEKQTITEQRNEAASELARWLLSKGFLTAGETEGQPSVVSRIPGGRFVGANWKGQRQRFKPKRGLCTVWITIGIRTTCVYIPPRRDESHKVVEDLKFIANLDTLKELGRIKEIITGHIETD